MSDTAPAIIKHMVAVTMHQFQSRIGDGRGLTVDVKTSGQGNRWFVDTVVKGASNGKNIDVVIRNEYKRLKRSGCAWVTYNPQVIQDGVTNIEAGKSVSEIIEGLLKQAPTVSGDLTQGHKAETHGPRSNSVETRRASVIRV